MHTVFKQDEGRGGNDSDAVSNIESYGASDDNPGLCNSEEKHKVRSDKEGEAL